METKKHDLQKWIDSNGIEGIVFFPFNSSESSAMDLMDDANNARIAYEAGNFAPYEDTAKERDLSEFCVS